MDDILKINYIQRGEGDRGVGETCVSGVCRGSGTRGVVVELSYSQNPIKAGIAAAVGKTLFGRFHLR